MTQMQAREQLLKETEDDVRHDMAKMIRRVEEEAKQESDRRVRNIISTGIQRAWPRATPPPRPCRWSSCRPTT